MAQLKDLIVNGIARVVGTLFASTINEGGTNLADKYLGKTAQASDSAKLGGTDASSYATQSWVTGKGYTTNSGTVTSVVVKMNGAVKGTITTSGTIDLGSVAAKSHSHDLYWHGETTDSTDNVFAFGKKYEIDIDDNSANPLVFQMPSLGTTATTAAAGNHTHTTSIATSTGTNQLTLAHGSKYAITAGGSSYVFTMPSLPTASTNTLGCVKIGAGLTISGGVVAPSFGTGYSNCARGNHTHDQVNNSQSGFMSVSDYKLLHNIDYKLSIKDEALSLLFNELNNRIDNTVGVQSVAVKMNGSVKGTITTSGTIDLGDVVIPSDLNSYSKKIVYSASTSYNLTLYRYVDYPTYQVVTISSSTSTWKIYNTVPSGYSVYYGYPRYVRYTNTTTATKTIQINFSAVCGAKTYSLPAGKSVEVCIFEPAAGVTPTAKWSACDL